MPDLLKIKGYWNFLSAKFCKGCTRTESPILGTYKKKLCRAGGGRPVQHLPERVEERSFSEEVG